MFLKLDYDIYTIVSITLSYFNRNIENEEKEKRQTEHVLVCLSNATSSEVPKVLLRVDCLAHTLDSHSQM